MKLYEQIEQDMKSALGARDAVKLSTLRFLKSALKYAAIEKKTDCLEDSDIQHIIRKQIKQRRESIEQFERGGRPELAEKEKAEAVILEGYLPKQLAESELETLVRETVQTAGATGKKDFGRVMKILMDRSAGQADPKRLSELLGKILV